VPSLEQHYAQRRGADRSEREAVGMAILAVSVLAGLALDMVNHPDRLDAMIEWRIAVTLIMLSAGITLRHAKKPWQELVLIAVPCVSFMVMLGWLTQYIPVFLADRYAVASVTAPVWFLVIVPVRPITAIGTAAGCAMALPLILLFGPGPLSWDDGRDIPMFGLIGFAISVTVALRSESRRRIDFLQALRYELTAVDMNILNG